MNQRLDTYNILARILAGSERQPNGCLVWKKSKRWGYGQIRVDNKVHRAHRLVWKLVFGPIPTRMFVCHNCDNKPCLEPTHLFVGTTLDNIHDAKDKGRLWSTGGGGKR